MHIQCGECILKAWATCREFGAGKGKEAQFKLKSWGFGGGRGGSGSNSKPSPTIPIWRLVMNQEKKDTTQQKSWFPQWWSPPTPPPLLYLPGLPDYGFYSAPSDQRGGPCSFADYGSLGPQAAQMLHSEHATSACNSPLQHLHSPDQFKNPGLYKSIYLIHLIWEAFFSLFFFLFSFIFYSCGQSNLHIPPWLSFLFFLVIFLLLFWVWKQSPYFFRKRKTEIKGLAD